MNTNKVLPVLLFTVCAAFRPVWSAPPLAEAILREGACRQNQHILIDHLKNNPTDDQERFGLGAVQFVAAIEGLGQQFYRFGLRNTSNTIGSMVPLLRLPIPENPDPEILTYQDSRKLLQAFIDDLAVAEATLSGVSDPNVKLPLEVTDIHFKFSDDGTALVSLADILQRMRVVRNPQPIFIVFDRADVTWLRGYCHLLTAMCEFVLAHDGKELFDSTAQLFFKKVESPYPFLSSGRRVFGWQDEFDIADLVAFIHLIRLPVAEPARMEATLSHLEQVLALSSEMWELALAETDDDHEWIPNPKQRGELGQPVIQAMVDSWLSAATEGTKVLKGEKLIPFWRGNTNKGVNLNRVFKEPTTFDLVLWIQGTAAAPYLEEGSLTQPEVWTRMQQVFRGEFFLFAIWFN